MNKSLLSIILLLVLGFAAPQLVYAAEAIEIIDAAAEQDITVTTVDQSIIVSGANGMILSIYNVAGVKVASFKVEGDSKRYDLNLNRGCYIVKVGDLVRKIFIH